MLTLMYIRKAMWSFGVRLRIIVFFVPVLVVSACSRQVSEARQFELHGQILAIRSDHEVLIKHDDIQGFMPAMTMPYKVRDTALLQGKSAGDLISATLVVSDTDAWLTRIEKTGTAPIAEPVPEPSPAASVALLKPGDAAPETSLTDQDGRPISLADWRGSVVGVTFIYTRCPLPQFCPLLDRRFAETQRRVKAEAALAAHVRLLSVSFDPDADTPAVLRAHAAKLGADPHMWRFATAPREVVDRFAAAFGVNVIREKDSSITHNLRTAVIDPAGRIVSVYDGGDWTADQIVSDMRRALAAR